MAYNAESLWFFLNHMVLSAQNTSGPLLVGNSKAHIPNAEETREAIL